MKSRILIDLDGTIAEIEKDVSYKNRKVIKEVADAVKNAVKMGHDVTIFTSRNMRKYNGNIDKILKYTKPVVLKWLAEKGIQYNDVVFGKTWCGENGYYVDDRNLHIEEYGFKFNGPYAEESFDVVVSFYNEENNVKKAHENNKKLERLLFIDKYIYVNNGSRDNTYQYLKELKKNDEKIIVVDIKDNLGYGYGYKSGFRVSGADNIITNHADSQFDAYSFLYSNIEELSKYKYMVPNIFPIRKNRPPFDSFNTIIVKLIVSLIQGRRIREFNGQPKVIRKRDINGKIELFPDDFTFDLKLYLSITDNNKLFLSVLQKNRIHGVSTWNFGVMAKIKLFYNYIYFAAKERKRRINGTKSTI